MISLLGASQPLLVYHLKILDLSLLLLHLLVHHTMYHEIIEVVLM